MGEFFVWLAGLPTWLGVLLFFIVFIALLVFAYIIVRIGFRIKYRETEISLFGRKKRKEEEPSLPYSPHRECNHKNDIVLLLNTVNQLQYQKFHLFEIDLLKEQMKYIEQKLDLIRSTLQRQYIQILQSKQIADLTSNTNFLNYKNVLGAIQMDMIDHFRHMMRENHLNDMDDDTFLHYCEDKFIFITNEMTDYLNSLYIPNEDVSREELYNWNRKLLPELQMTVNDMLQNSRKISVQYMKKVNDIDKKIENEVHKYI